MPPRKRIKKRKKKRHIILVLFLIIVGIFLFIEESGKDTGKKAPVISKPEPRIKTPDTRDREPSGLPKVAIVMDDLGNSKEIASKVFRLKTSVTLSIIPHETYSVWVAEEGHRLGHDIIVHVPMEALTPQNLGKGALHTWMTDGEIARTLLEDIRSIPHISGVSSHMGSAFTEDRRAMKAFILELKKHPLFFLDSITTPRSVAYSLAKDKGLAALRRDVFLDNMDDPREIENQWERLVEIARKEGYAIALAHPRENTLNFLQKALKESDNIEVVPITELLTADR